MTLPGEIWTQIFGLAADEDILFQPGFPTSLAESAWCRDYWKFRLDVNDPSSEWILRSPEQALDILQKRSYATKKAIICTCRQWRQLASESLFRCLYVSQATMLTSLCSMLEASSAVSTTSISSHGWWTRRIHLGPDIHSTMGQSMNNFQNDLVSIIRHCPNVEIFLFQRPLGSCFGPVLDTLATYASRRLHTIHLNVPGESISKVIWAFSALPHIVAAHIDVDTDVPPIEEVAHLGSAADLQLKLPYLQQMSLRGFVGAFLEQLGGWDLPMLRTFGIDDGTSLQDHQDVTEFLKNHGANLLLLDLNLKNFVNVPLVLDLCPILQTFAFNADWRITPHDNAASSIVNRPHPHITTIGLHGLTYAFGVGTRYLMATENNSFEASYAARSNDLNMSALNKRSFPNLQRIRLLSRRVLEELNKSNGPSSKSGGYDRWVRWWQACAGAQTRLEDCTGHSLGTLPGEPEGEEESDDEDDVLEDGDSEGESTEDEDEEEEEVESESGDKTKWQTSTLPQVPNVLTQLIREVRAMNETRDEALIARVRIPRPPSPWGT